MPSGGKYLICSQDCITFQLSQKSLLACWHLSALMPACMNRYRGYPWIPQGTPLAWKLVTRWSSWRLGKGLLVSFDSLLNLGRVQDFLPTFVIGSNSRAGPQIPGASPFSETGSPFWILYNHTEVFCWPQRACLHVSAWQSPWARHTQGGLCSFKRSGLESSLCLLVAMKDRLW